MNWSRIVLGGLLAGLVFNVLEVVSGALFIGGEFEAALTALGMTMPQTPAIMMWYVGLGFFTGIAVVWLYAAIRPRFGPGIRTAVIAGLAGWVFMGLINAIAEGPMGFFPVRLHALMNAAWIIELPLSAVAGAWIYRES